MPELAPIHSKAFIQVIASRRSHNLLQDQSTEQMTAAAAATAIVREAAASAVVDVLEGASEEEKAAKMASIKQEKMRKVIRCCPTPLVPFLRRKRSPLLSDSVLAKLNSAKLSPIWDLKFKAFREKACSLQTATTYLSTCNHIIFNSIERQFWPALASSGE